MFTKELILTLHKLFQKIQCELTFANIFHEARITLISKAGKDIRKITHTYSLHTKNPPQNTSKVNPPTHKNTSISYNRVRFYPQNATVAHQTEI